MFPARTVFFVVNENVTEDSILPRKGETACFRKILSWLAEEFGDILLDEIVDVTKDLLKIEQNCFLRGSSM